MPAVECLLAPSNTGSVRLPLLCTSHCALSLPRAAPSLNTSLFTHPVRRLDIELVLIWR